jgi:hypothetical protein
LRDYALRGVGLRVALFPDFWHGGEHSGFPHSCPAIRPPGKLIFGDRR